MGTWPEVDPLFDRLKSFQEATVKDFTRTLGKGNIIGATRRYHPNSLPCRSTSAALGNMHQVTFPISYAMRLQVDHSKTISEIKHPLQLMKRTAERFVEEIRHIPNIVVVAFRSIQCGFNTWTAEFLEKSHRSILCPKWTPDMLEWVPEKDRSPKLFYPSLNMIHSLHKLPSWLRPYLDIPRLEENYADWNGHKLAPRFAQLVKEKKTVILIDDTLSTGVSMALQFRLLQRFHVPLHAIHAFVLLNERTL